MINYAVENVIFGIMFLVALRCFNINKPVSIAIIVSALSGLILPEIGYNDYRSFIHIVAALICLTTFYGWVPNKLKVEGNEINYAVSYLYCLRVVVDLPRIAGFTGVEVTWVISMALLFVQLLLLLGDGFGYGSTINNYLSKCRSRVNAFIFQ